MNPPDNLHNPAVFEAEWKVSSLRKSPVTPNVAPDIALDVAPMVGARNDGRGEEFFAPTTYIDNESYSVNTIRHDRKQIQSRHGKKIEGVAASLGITT